MERYNRILSLNDEMWSKSCPILIEKGALLHDSEKDQNLLQLRLRSLSTNTIKAVEMRICTYSIDGSQIEDSKKLFLDLSIKCGDSFGDQDPIILSEKTARKFSFFVEKVYFADETSWQDDQEMRPIKPQKEIDSEVGTLSDAFIRECKKRVSLGKYYVPAFSKSYWRCTCGALNLSDSESCWSCGIPNEFIKSITDKEFLEKQQQAWEKQEEEKRRLKAAQEEKERREREKRKEEEEKARAIQEEEEKKRNRKMAIIGIVVSVAMLAIVTVYFLFFNADRSNVTSENVTSENGTEIVKEPSDSIINDADGTVTWTCVYFGNYWQKDTNGDGKTNQKDEKEPIKWRVLSVDRDDAFLLADRNLDAQEYNNNWYNNNWEEVTWKTCRLRDWLNTEFYQNAFSEAEQDAIMTAEVINEDNPEYGTEGGDNTRDKIYILSLEEIMNPSFGFTENYEGTKTRMAENTAYVEKNDTVSKAWWLRSNRRYSYFASHVGGNGNVNIVGYYVNSVEYNVRPVLHLDLNSSVWCSAEMVKVNED